MIATAARAINTETVAIIWIGLQMEISMAGVTDIGITITILRRLVFGNSTTVEGTSTMRTPAMAYHFV